MRTDSCNASQTVPILMKSAMFTQLNLVKIFEKLGFLSAWNNRMFQDLTS